MDKSRYIFENDWETFKDSDLESMLKTSEIKDGDIVTQLGKKFTAVVKSTITLTPIKEKS
jgi:hypothetical protein